MGTLACQGIQIDRQRRHQGLALPGAHFGNFAPVQHNAADQLHVIVALAERALGGFANSRKGLWQQLVERLALGDPGLENRGLSAQFLVGQRFYIGFQRVDPLDQRLQGADVPVV